MYHRLPFLLGLLGAALALALAGVSFRRVRGLELAVCF